MHSWGCFVTKGLTKTGRGLHLFDTTMTSAIFCWWALSAGLWKFPITTSVAKLSWSTIIITLLRKVFLKCTQILWPLQYSAYTDRITAVSVVIGTLSKMITGQRMWLSKIFNEQINNTIPAIHKILIRNMINFSIDFFLALQSWLFKVPKNQMALSFYSK